MPINNNVLNLYKSQKNYIYAECSNGIYISRDNGNTFTQQYASSSFCGTLCQLSNGHILAGFYNGEIFENSDPNEENDTWTQIAKINTGVTPIYTIAQTDTNKVIVGGESEGL
jgi:hypothetical protein